MKKLLTHLWNSNAVRYVFFGFCTTLVNMGVFLLLRSFTPLSLTAANVISIVLAIIFAFFMNAAFVFHTKTKGTKKWLQFATFFGSRLSTMFIEVVGVFLLAELLDLNEFFSKISTQFIEFLLNFVISKYIVFQARKE